MQGKGEVVYGANCKQVITLKHKVKNPQPTTSDFLKQLHKYTKPKVTKVMELATLVSVSFRLASLCCFKFFSSYHINSTQQA